LPLAIRWLIGFLLTLVAILVFLVYRFVGIGLVELTLDSSMIDEPLLVVRLDGLHNTNRSNAYIRDFLRPRDSLLVQEGASRVFFGITDVVANGPDHFQRNLVSIHSIPKGRIFTDLTTSQEYIVLENGVAEVLQFRTEFVGHFPDAIEFSRENVLLLATLHGDSETDFLKMLELSLRNQKGEIVYSAEPIFLGSTVPTRFNHFVILGFESKSLVNSWFLSTNRKSLFATESSEINRLVMFSITRISPTRSELSR